MSSATVRINKRIKDLGLAGRREADELLAAGCVFVNGKKVTELGTQVTLADQIEIKRSVSKTGTPNVYKYYIFNKPKGVVSHTPQYGEQEVKDFFPKGVTGLSIIGRLDKHSEGLMLLTTDRRIVERVLSPKYDHEKEYEVTVQEKISNNMVRLFEKGFTVRGRFTAKPAKVTLINQFKFKIALTEGKKHQIRLMANDLHYTVSKLKRVRIMNIKLGTLPEGKLKELDEKSRKDLLKSLELKEI
jgi:pseudouridine synthase